MEKKTWAEIESERKLKWLDEHLPYELKMMRHSLNRMEEAGVFYLDWNAFHSAFGVAAANMAAFLTNKEGKGNSFRAHDFVAGFRSRKDDLAKVFEKLEPQIFHLGQGRPSDTGKFDLADAKRAAGWIEEEMGKFVEKLPDRSLWNEARSRPGEAPPISTETLAKNIQTACTADPFVVVSSSDVLPSDPYVFSYRK
jgi:hypothetical protein